MKKNLSISLLGWLLSGQTLSAQEKPNILMILVDDLGYSDLSCQQTAKDIHTPNIDKLLNEGIRFTNFHSNSPVSSPSRAALLSGRFPDMVGVPGVIRTHKEDSWGYLAPEAILIPEMLKKENYHTAIIGKWHLGLKSPNIPTERGFDLFHGFLGDMMDDYNTHLRHKNNYMRKNIETINPQGHATELFSNWAIEYLNNRKEKKDPFFLYLAYNAPHTPIQPPIEWLDKVRKREPSASEKRTKLIALIEHLDDQIGKVYKTLEENGQLENTLIIFTSDNGGQADAAANNLPYRGAKQEMYEGGIRVPAGAYWKGKIAPYVNNNFAMLSDLFPTFCEVAGVSINHPIDGMSLLPLLRGDAVETDNRTVFWVRREGNPLYGGMAYYAARSNGRKILQNTPWEPIQYFDMINDPCEKEPLANKDSTYRSLFKQLTEHIRLSGAIPWLSNN